MSLVICPPGHRPVIRKQDRAASDWREIEEPHSLSVKCLLILAVDHLHRRFRSIDIIEQTRVNADARGRAVPSAGRLEIRAVAEGAAAAGGAEIVRDHLGVPAIGRHVRCRRRQPELRRLVLGPWRSTLGAERTGAARQLGRGLAIDLERRLAAVATSGDGHFRASCDWR